MTRPLRLAVPDGIYHVTARGNRRQVIYLDDDDRQEYLRRLARVTGRHRWKVLSFCLMANHVHLLIRTPMANLSEGMQLLNGTYAQAFNRRHGGDGHLWQGRFAASLVQEERYLRDVLRYIALNPVRAGLSATADEWAWSAHAALAGLATVPRFLARAEALAWCGGDAATYRAFVASGHPEDRLPVRGVIVGDEAFGQQHLAAIPPSPEIARRERAPFIPPLDELLSADDVDAAIAIAHVAHGYSLSAIARHLGVHRSSVSRRLRDLENRQRTV